MKTFSILIGLNLFLAVGAFADTGADALTLQAGQSAIIDRGAGRPTLTVSCAATPRNLPTCTCRWNEGIRDSEVLINDQHLVYPGGGTDGARSFIATLEAYGACKFARSNYPYSPGC